MGFNRGERGGKDYRLKDRSHLTYTTELVWTDGLLLDYLLDLRNPYPP
jgi:hypothetical protein